MASAAQTVGTDWPLRTWALAILGASFALAMQQLSDLPDTGWEWGARMVAAAIVFLGTSGLAFGLAWQRGRLVPADCRGSGLRDRRRQCAAVERLAQ